MLRNRYFSFFIILLLCAIHDNGFAQSQGLIIQLHQGQSWQNLFPGEKNKAASPKLLSAALHIYFLPPSPEKKELEMIRFLEKHPAVRHVTRDQEVQFRVDPNDDRYDRQWSLPRIQAPAVWDLTSGGRTSNGDEIVVAVIDSGFDILHPDLVQNIWQNSIDIDGDSLDNDQNGYIDDIHGWNFVENSGIQEIDWHGQSVAGIIGARGNNGLGVSGINWEVKLMLFSVRKVSHVLAAFDYALMQRQRYNESRGGEGAFVVAINTSFGLNNAFCDSQPAWRDMYELLGTQGILSVASPPNSNINVETEGDVPTTCLSEFLLTTLRTDENDEKHTNSGYGAVSIDLGVPGQNIHTTVLNDGYNNFSGTSASAPHLTGAIALLYSLPCPTLANLALNDPPDAALLIKSALLNGVDKKENLIPYTLTGGRLNIKNSADILMDGCNGKEGLVALIKVWPNPARHTIHIQYQLESSQSRPIFIFNALGQEVARLTLPPTGSVTGRKPFPLPALPAGVYYLVLKTTPRPLVKGFVVH